MTNGEVMAGSRILNQDERGRRSDDISRPITASARVESSGNRLSLALLDGRAGAGSREGSKKERGDNGELHLEEEEMIGMLGFGVEF